MASIRGMSEPVKGTVFDINDDVFTIGRNPDNKACLPDASVSGEHCLIERDGGKYTLRDLNSTNGTQRNGRPVQASRLNPQDIIKVGSVDLMFEGTDVEREDDDSPASANTVFKGIAEKSGSATQVSSAFAKKRDHRRIVNFVIYLFAAMAVGLLVFFLHRLLQ